LFSYRAGQRLPRSTRFFWRPAPRIRARCARQRDGYRWQRLVCLNDPKPLPSSPPLTVRLRVPLWSARAGEVHRALACWATPLLAQRAREAAATDLSGLWSRDASLNVGVEEALLARGLSAESAAAEATRAYVQQWRRTNEHDDGSSWQVTTFDAGGAGAHRTLIYSTGDWTEDFSGTSTLHGGVDAPTSPAVLVRRTSWMLHRPVPSTSRADAEVAAYGADSDHGAFRAVPPASLTGLATHTTWTSRTNDTGEIVCRYLHDGAMIVRRTQLKRRCGQVTALTVSEETFVQLLEAAPPAGDVP